MRIILFPSPKSQIEYENEALICTYSRLSRLYHRILGKVYCFLPGYFLV